MADNLALTEEILKLTQSMLEAAQKSQWNEVQVQERRRQVLLHDLHLNEVSEGNGGQAIAANLEHTMDLNDQLVDLGVQARSELEENMGTLRRGRKANLAYTGVR